MPLPHMIYTNYYGDVSVSAQVCTFFVQYSKKRNMGDALCIDISTFRMPIFSNYKYNTHIGLSAYYNGAFDITFIRDRWIFD